VQERRDDSIGRKPSPAIVPRTGALRSLDWSADTLSMSDLDEKRDRERLEILGELHGEVMVFQPLLVKEISVGGCVVETAFPLHLDSLHDLRLTLGERSIVLKGRVVHSQISDVDQEVVRYRSGVEFIEPADRIRDAIEHFIDTIKASRFGKRK
jgi:hypothetical protein